MDYVIGCDLGTSALKVTLVNARGEVVRSVSKNYPLHLPQPGYSEQSAEDWLKALYAALKEVATPEEKKTTRGLAIAGQMHGLVALDQDAKPIRDVILWNDSRSVEECHYLNDTIGKETLVQETGNIAYPGFTAPKILWLAKHEPDAFKAMKHVLLPKDYLVYCLTGIFSSDYSDASGTLLFDPFHKQWSEKMCEIMGVSIEMLPPLHQSGDLVGTLKKDVAEELGYSSELYVLAGAADNAAAALGSGVSGEGAVNISLGTSGTIFVSSQHCLYDSKGAIHCFMAGDGGYSLLACSLSSASCLRWLNEDIYLTKDYSGEEKRIFPAKLGQNHVYFLPYLMGERSPINDPDARSLFIGMDLSTKREDLTLAVLEGVSFALRDSFERIKELGGHFTSSHITGGGSKNALWRKILCNVMNIDLSLVGEEAGASYGMALLCLVHSHYFSSLAEAEAFVKPEETIHPNAALVAAYEERYQSFKKIYPQTKSLFPLL
jgi:xylulokinase